MTKNGREHARQGTENLSKYALGTSRIVAPAGATATFTAIKTARTEVNQIAELLKFPHARVLLI